MMIIGQIKVKFYIEKYVCESILGFRDLTNKCKNKHIWSEEYIISIFNTLVGIYYTINFPFKKSQRCDFFLGKLSKLSKQFEWAILELF